MSTVQTRVITAAFLIPLVVVATLRLDTNWFLLLILLPVLAASWEWSRLSGITQPLFRVAYLLFTLACCLFFSHYEQLLWLAAVWWLFSLWWLPRFPNSTMLLFTPVAMWLIGAMLLATTWVALGKLHSLPEQGRELVLFLFVLIWIADSAAFFAGRKFGKTKLAPSVSPGKSIEGVIGALLACSIYSLVLAPSFGFAPMPFLLLAIFIVIFSVIGDLVESAFKRNSGYKDSGSILPGHGGVLDRIDSLTAAAPLFLLGLEFVK